MTIAVVDWGVGGMGFVSAVGAGHDILYVSDSGQPPYGTLPAARLAERLSALSVWLAEQGAAEILFACNAASTVLDQVRSPVPISGTIEAGLALVAKTPGTIGVIGGQRTIAADVYGAPLRAAGRVVRQQAAQPLSALVERGLIDGPEVDAAIERVLAPLGEVDALLLACTHYPALGSIFQRLRPGWVLLDPISLLVQRVRPPRGTLRAWTTGDPVDLRYNTVRCWGFDPGPTQRCPISLTKTAAPLG